MHRLLLNMLRMIVKTSFCVSPVLYCNCAIVIIVHLIPMRGYLVLIQTSHLRAKQAASVAQLLGHSLSPT